jgi:hypothetical protein
MGLARLLAWAGAVVLVVIGGDLVYSGARLSVYPGVAFVLAGGAVFVCGMMLVSLLVATGAAD